MRDAFPTNERYFFCTDEIYSHLQEEDYRMGFRRRVVQGQQLKNALAQAQHWEWERAEAIFTEAIAANWQEEGSEERRVTVASCYDDFVWEEVHVETLKMLGEYK